jgi:plastocyanin
MNIGRPLRISAAIALLIGGLVHLQLYFQGYRSIDKIGPSFLLNAIASALIAAAIVVRREWIVRLAGTGLAVGTIAAFVVSRQGNGLFDFREHGLNPSPQATIALVVEIAAFIMLAATFLPSVRDETQTSSMMMAGLATVSATLFLALGVYWANHYGSTTTSAFRGGIQIADFAFDPKALTVARGSTVTWTNEDAVEHSVVANDRSFGSDELGQGAAFEFTFDTPGDFTYMCGIHPQMNGTVTVTG